MPGDTFQGETYYRLRLPSPDVRPQNFTVLVGSRWVASLQTKEWLSISLGNGLAEKLPGPLRPVFPRGLVAKLFVGSSDKYISLVLHETFHAFQGMTVPSRLESADRTVTQEKRYPWDSKSRAACTIQIG